MDPPLVIDLAGSNMCYLFGSVTVGLCSDSQLSPLACQPCKLEIKFYHTLPQRLTRSK